MCAVAYAILCTPVNHSLIFLMAVIFPESHRDYFTSESLYSYFIIKFFILTQKMEHGSRGGTLFCRAPSIKGGELFIF